MALELSFEFGWKVTLVAMAFVPFMVLGSFVQTKSEAGENEKSCLLFGSSSVSSLPPVGDGLLA